MICCLGTGQTSQPDRTLTNEPQRERLRFRVEAWVLMELKRERPRFEAGRFVMCVCMCWEAGLF